MFVVGWSQCQKLQQWEYGQQCFRRYQQTETSSKIGVMNHVQGSGEESGSLTAVCRGPSGRGAVTRGSDQSCTFSNQ